MILILIKLVNFNFFQISFNTWRNIVFSSHVNIHLHMEKGHIWMMLIIDLTAISIILKARIPAQSVYIWLNLRVCEIEKEYLWNLFSWKRL